MSKEITYKNIQYGQIVEYHHGYGGYHSGVRVHFFNRKGVLIGNYYEFVPYNKLKNAWDKPTWPRMYMDYPLESMRQFWYETLCRVQTWFIKSVEMMDYFEAGRK